MSDRRWQIASKGISGSDLKKRIQEIMTWRGSLPVTAREGDAGCRSDRGGFSLPFVIKILRAQTLPPTPAFTYEAVSIHKSDPAHPSFLLRNWTTGAAGEAIIYLSLA